MEHTVESRLRLSAEAQPIFTVIIAQQLESLRQKFGEAETVFCAGSVEIRRAREQRRRSSSPDSSQSSTACRTVFAGRRADARGDLVPSPAEVVLHLGLGPAAHRPPVTHAVGRVAERDRTDPAIVGSVEIDAVFAVTPARARRTDPTWLI